MTDQNTKKYDKYNKVLIIDDNISGLSVACKKLKKEGYKVFKSTNGRDGIQIAKEKQPHVILLDVIMDKMNGFEVCKILKKEKKTEDIPVIFLSADHNLESQVKGLKLGAQDYIIKGSPIEILLAKVKTLADLRRKNLTIEFINKTRREWVREIKILSDRFMNLEI